MAFQRQPSQPEDTQGLASRQELREVLRSASAKYRREPRRPSCAEDCATVPVTCQLCHYSFEQPVASSARVVSCPACGFKFELKISPAVDSLQIEDIERELDRLRSEIESHFPKRRDNREKSVIGPVPMQTVKKNFDRPTENKTEDAGFYSMVGRVRSALVHLENEQLDDYLQWRNSLSHRKAKHVEPEEPQDTAPEESPEQAETFVAVETVAHCDTCTVVAKDAGRVSYADYSERCRSGKMKRRVKIAALGIVLCLLFCAVVLVAELARSGNRSQLANRETSETGEMIAPSEIIEIPRPQPRNVKPGKSANPAADTPTVPTLEMAQASPVPALTGQIPEFPVPLPGKNVDATDETGTSVALDRQLQETQTQLTQITQQYEQSRHNNEQLERTVRQNEAESLLWESYAHAEKDPVRSMILSLQAIERFKELELDVPTNARWALNQSLASQNLGISLNGFHGGVDAMTLSRDGQWFLFAGGDGAVWLWDISKHDQAAGSFQLDAIKGGVSQLLMTSNVQYGVCVGRGGTIRIWDLKLPMPSEKPTDISDTRCRFTNAVVSEDGRWLAAYGKPPRRENGREVAGEEVNDVFLWDLNQLARNGVLGAPIVLKGHEKPIRSLTISSNSKWLVSGSEDRTVRVYDLKAAYPAAEQIVLKGHELAVNSVAVSPDGRWLVTGGRDSILRVWDLQSRQSMSMPMQLQEHEGWISTLVFSPDGRFLASGSYDNTIRLWRMTGVAKPEVAHVLSGHIGPIKSVEFSRQGNQLLSLGFDREARLWNLGQGDPSENPLTFRSVQNPISSAMLTGDGKWLILAQQKPNSAGSSGLRLWPLEFDEAFACAAGFAEARFPAMYRRRGSDGIAPGQQEERIARTGSLSQTGTQFPVVPQETVQNPQNHAVPPFITPSTVTPPSVSATPMMQQFTGPPATGVTQLPPVTDQPATRLHGTQLPTPGQAVPNPPADGQINLNRSAINITLSPR